MSKFIRDEHHTTPYCIQLLITEIILPAYNVNKAFIAKYEKIDIIGTVMYITYGGWIEFKVDILLNATKLVVRS